MSERLQHFLERFPRPPGDHAGACIHTRFHEITIHLGAHEFRNLPRVRVRLRVEISVEPRSHVAQGSGIRGIIRQVVIFVRVFLQVEKFWTIIREMFPFFIPGAAMKHGTLIPRS